MEIIIERKLEVGVRLVRELGVKILVAALEIPVEIGMDDELEGKLILAKNEFFQRPLDLDRDALMALDEAVAGAIGTARINRLSERFAAPLARHFDKAEFAHPKDCAFR